MEEPPAPSLALSSASRALYNLLIDFLRIRFPLVILLIVDLHLAPVLGFESLALGCAEPDVVLLHKLRYLIISELRIVVLILGEALLDVNLLCRQRPHWFLDANAAAIFNYILMNLILIIAQVALYVKFLFLKALFVLHSFSFRQLRPLVVDLRSHLVAQQSPHPVVLEPLVVEQLVRRRVLASQLFHRHRTRVQVCRHLII